MADQSKEPDSGSIGYVWPMENAQQLASKPHFEGAGNVFPFLVVCHRVGNAGRFELPGSTHEELRRSFLTSWWAKVRALVGREHRELGETRDNFRVHLYHLHVGGGSSLFHVCDFHLSNLAEQSLSVPNTPEIGRLGEPIAITCAKLVEELRRGEINIYELSEGLHGCMEHVSGKLRAAAFAHVPGKATSEEISDVSLSLSQQVARILKGFETAEVAVGQIDLECSKIGCAADNEESMVVALETAVAEAKEVNASLARIGTSLSDFADWLADRAAHQADAEPRQ